MQSQIDLTGFLFITNFKAFYHLSLKPLGLQEEK